MGGLIWAVIVVLFVLWALGMAFSIGGGLIHILLVVAAVLIVFNLVTRGRAAI
jgi:hypothetical protein